MSLSSSALLLAVLSLGSPTESQALPATCVSPPAISVIEPPRRRQQLLPTVVAGVDHRPQRRGRVRFDADATDPAPASATPQQRDRTSTRWTLSLRWRSSASPRTTPPSRPDFARPALCNRLISLQRQRPADLSQAIDHWTWRAQILALLSATKTSEAGHE